MSNKQIKLKEVFFAKTSFFWHHKTLLVAVVILATTGCISFKPNAKKSAKSLYTTFYLGDKGTQYFIKPLELKSANNETFTVDFTFRDSQSTADSTHVIVNSSILTKSLHSSLDSIIFSNSSNSFTISKLNVLFKEKKEGDFLLRTSGKTNLGSLKALFFTSNWQVNVFTNSNEYSFTTTKKTNKSVPLLYTSIFDLITLK